MRHDEYTPIGSVRRALRLLDVVAASDRPLPARALAHQTGEPLPTTNHLLRTLVHERHLRRVDDGYLLGDRVHALLRRGRDQLIAARAHPTLRMLNDELGCPAYFATYADGELRLLDVVDTPALPRFGDSLGLRDSAHAAALSSCLLACLPAPERAAHLRRQGVTSPRVEPYTDPTALYDRLAEPSPTDPETEEEYAGGTAIWVAAPVRGHSLLGALAVSVSRRRLPRFFERRSQLSHAARRIARVLEFVTTGP
ncbi:IclR family transcriptional regulator [Actinopolymorpha pittospori]|uniref:DNA-binding IclR family transcriptional regulator n=1 Tax=Actinopolymorpha pittospori TaxID=648752 RepID=A0A927N8K9_9ACTN|nr:DNA-binding IclR family transcriptional regulator [Actinopolymorpha pittospori]